MSYTDSSIELDPEDVLEEERPFVSPPHTERILPSPNVPSVAPVAVRASLPPLPPPRSASLVLAICATLIAGSAALGTFLALRHRAKTQETIVVVAAPPLERVQAIASTSAAPPTIAVDALPKADIDADKTLLSFPRSADGHRIWIDGALITPPHGAMKTKCGKHTIRIGSAQKPRDVDLPCGAAYGL